jgi:hypothetical protein
MEEVTDLYPDKVGVYKTRVLVTAIGRGEMDALVSADLGGKLEVMAEKGFYKSPTIHDEGQGVWAFGPRGETVRIAGYFPRGNDWSIFVIGGAYKGKFGSGNKRKRRGDTVVDRVAQLKQQGEVKVVPPTQKPQ